MSTGEALPEFGSCEVLRNQCQHARRAWGTWRIGGGMAAGAGASAHVTSSSISSARANIELSGNKELGLHFRVIHAWLVGRKMSAAADLREDTRLFLWAVLKGN